MNIINFLTTFPQQFLQQFLHIFMISAPWLMLGIIIAGLINACIPKNFLNKHLGHNNPSAIVKSALLGAPLPLCSCGVIPAALGLRRAGASKAATTSFLISTPETGVDSISITYALLGPFMAIVRPIAAVSTAMVAGFSVMFFEKSQLHNNSDNDNNNDNNNKQGIQPQKVTSCCSKKKDTDDTNNFTNTISDTSTRLQSSTTISHKIKNFIDFTFVSLVKDTSVWLVIGLVIAALIMTIIPDDFLAKWGATPYAYIVMALIGVPMYICATASTPIAAGLLFAGVSPGAILIFLLIGPATNIATLAIVRKELGNVVLWIYLSAIVFMSFSFGIILLGFRALSLPFY